MTSTGQHLANDASERRSGHVHDLTYYAPGLYHWIALTLRMYHSSMFCFSLMAIINILSTRTYPPRRASPIRARSQMASDGSLFGLSRQRVTGPRYPGPASSCDGSAPLLPRVRHPEIALSSHCAYSFLSSVVNTKCLHSCCRRRISRFRINSEVALRFVRQ